MTDADPGELRLIEAADGVASTQVDLTEMTQLLEDWLSGLARALDEHRLPPPPSLRESHPLVHEVHAMNDLLDRSAAGWSREWALLEPARLLAQAFDDRVMLLVFGKFNAGKSSLCNLLAERFVAHERAVRYFHLEAGHVVRTTQPLQEGTTETTARLQGVGLGHGLVLLDAPGLHSVTPENAALTRRFTDSADAVLWLTSSTSPGQVQELDEMARELHRRKPLLPVITRSDVVEEDEIDGDIVKRLRDKTPANRRLQEDDVHSRARDKLARMGVPPDVLKRPVSISVHAARERGQTPQALAEGGFTRFCSAVLDLVGPARAYKQRKPVEVLLHHLQENVLGVVRSDIEPALHRLMDSLARERERLRQLQPRLTKRVWRRVAPALPGMLERHAGAPDVTGLLRELETLLREALACEVAPELGDHDIALSAGEDEPWIGMTESGVDSMTAGFERLHDALWKALDRRLVERLGTLFDACMRTVDGIERSAIALQDALARQSATFAEMRVHEWHRSEHSP